MKLPFVSRKKYEDLERRYNQVYNAYDKVCRAGENGYIVFFEDDYPKIVYAARYSNVDGELTFYNIFGYVIEKLSGWESLYDHGCGE